MSRFAQRLLEHLSFIWNGGASPTGESPVLLAKYRRVASSLFVMLLVSIAMFSVNSFLGTADGTVESDNYLISSGGAIAVALLYIQAYSRFKHLIAHLVVALYWSLITIILQSYGFDAPTWVWLLFVPVLAVILLDKIGPWLWALISIATLVHLGIREERVIMAAEGSIVLLLIFLPTYFYDRIESSYKIRLGENLNKLQQALLARDVAQQDARELDSTASLNSDILEQLAAGIIIFNEQANRVLYTNVTFQELFGYSDADVLISKDFRPSQLFETPNSESAIDVDTVIAAVRNAGSWIGECYGACKSGYRPWLKVHASCTDHARYGACIVFVVTDLTDLKDIEEKLRSSLSLSERTQRLALLGYWSLCLESREFTASNSMCEIYEVESGTIDPEIFTCKVHPDDLHACRSVLEQATTRQQPWNIEHRIITASGKTKWLHAIGDISTGAEGKALTLTGTIQDITERKTLEQFNEQNQKRLSRTEEKARVGSWELDLKTDQMEFSWGMNRVYEVQPSDEPMSYNNFLQLIDEADRNRVDQEYRRSLSNHSQLKLDHRLRLPDGSIKHILLSCETVYDDKRNAVRSVGMAQDITDHIVAEAQRKDLETQLQNSKKMEVLGHLASGIAHDFNNILTPILGYADLLLSDLSDARAPTEDLKSIKKASMRGRELVDQILLYSRKSRKQPEPVFVQEIIQEALHILAHSIPDNIRVETCIDENCKQIHADPSQIHRIIINLCKNAIQAMSQQDDGVLSISLSRTNLPSASVPNSAELKSGTYLHLEITDNGSGIDPEHINNIFDPFFSAKSADEGTGLGLSVVQGVVMEHSGCIEVTDSQAGGAAFSIYLPQRTENKANLVNTEHVQYGNKEHILLVDDDQNVGMVIMKMLTRLGYEVTFVTSAEEAIHLCENKADEFDLLLTDLAMPEMSGLELTRHLNHSNFRVPIILITGNSSDLLDANNEQLGVSAIIEKPVKFATLSAVIKKLFQERSAPTLRRSVISTESTKVH